MRNIMVKLKMSSLPVLLARQEVPAFSCPQLFDLCHFLRQVVFRDCEHNGYILTYTIVFVIPRNSLPGKTAQTNNYKQENVDTSCLASKTGSEAISNCIIAFSITRNLYAEKTA
mgnify:CR=1 FL=1